MAVSISEHHKQLSIVTSWHLFLWLYCYDSVLHRCNTYNKFRQN